LIRGEMSCHECVNKGTPAKGKKIIEEGSGNDEVYKRGKKGSRPWETGNSTVHLKNKTSGLRLRKKKSQWGWPRRLIRGEGTDEGGGKKGESRTG